MRQIKVIKAYTRMTSNLKSPDDLAYQDDVAVTFMRAMHPVAQVHCSRVSSPDAVNVMLEVLENLSKSLRKRIS
jgi:hypothetical protein